MPLSKGRSMANIGHSTKKLLNRASTSKSALDSGLNQEFVDTRRRLDSIATSLHDLHAQIHESRHVWTAVARSQRDFARALTSSFPQPGAVHSHATEVERVLRDVQRALIDTDEASPDGEDAGARAPHLRIADVLARYVENVESIKTEYAALELTYTEKARYERKVDALERKSADRGKDGGARLRRNMAKLDDVQARLDAKMDAVLTRMRDAFQKHEAVLQCAHHAFWCANNVYLTTLEKATHDVRAESEGVHAMLLGLELQEGRALLPLERRDTTETRLEALAAGALQKKKSLIGPAPAPSAESAPPSEAAPASEPVPASEPAPPPEPAATEVTDAPADEDAQLADKPQPENVPHAEPKNNMLSEMSSDSEKGAELMEDAALRIPDVPMETPQDPFKTRKRTPPPTFPKLVTT